MMVWVLYSFVLVGVLLAVRYGVRRTRRVIPLLKKQESDFLSEKFGARWMQAQQNADTSQGVFKWYKILREQQFSSRLSDEEGGLLFVKNDILIADQENRYWHCLLTTVESRSTEMALTALTELRARRALFNQPKTYIAAFGIHPQKSQLLNLEEASAGASAEN